MPLTSTPILRCLPLLLSAVTLLPACSDLRQRLTGRCSPYDFGLPPGVQAPRHPPGTCLTPARVALGRRLFYDKRLSGNGTQACATCHIQRLGFSDGRRRAVGSTGQVHPRNAQALANVGTFQTLTWFSSKLTRLDKQTLIPFFAQNSRTTIEELAISNKEWIVARRLRADPQYPGQFQAAFGDPKFTITEIARALAAFQTTFVSYRSAFDGGAMSAAARRGERLFLSSRTGCASCHGGPNFNLDKKAGRLWFQNVGLYNVRGQGDYPDALLHGRAARRANQGLFAVTGKSGDRGKFRTPSLRNVALTAPYMHDGSLRTLNDVVAFFNAGGRHVRRGPLRGDGRRNPNKDPRVRALGLSVIEQSELVAFLKALTDHCFVNDPRLSDPGQPTPVMRAFCSEKKP